jgi:membrane protease YdiL (CAAX protease family)
MEPIKADNQEVPPVSVEEPQVAKPAGYGPAQAIIFTLAIFFISQILASLLISLYPLARGQSAEAAQTWLENSTPAQFAYVLMIEVITVVSVFWLLRHWRLLPKYIGMVKPRLFDFARGLGAFILYFPVNTVASILLVKIVPSLNSNQNQDIGFQGAHSGGPELILVFISLVILPPIAEEILVRGFLFTGLRSKMKFIGAAVVTSALFGTAHLQIGSGKPWLWTAALDTFILSLFLCYLREHSKSLWPGICLHMIKNGFAFFLLFVAPLIGIHIS